MYAAGARVFVEAGPGSVLTRLVRRDPRRPAAPDGRAGGRAARSGLPGFLAALAQLAVAGVDIRTAWLFQRPGRRRRHARRPVASAPGWTVDGHLVRTAAGVIPADVLQPARRVPLPATSQASALEPILPNDQYRNGYAAATSGPEAMVAEFLRTSRELIAAQRDVMLGYLGVGAR